MLRTILSLLTILIVTPLFGQNDDLPANSPSTLDTRTASEDLLDSIPQGALPLIIYSEEDHHSRWLTISFHDVREVKAIQQPEITFNKAEGSFVIKFEGVDNVVPPQGTLVKEIGHFPLQYKSQFLDSTTLVISAMSKTFDQLKTSYSFDSAEYLIELIYSSIPTPELNNSGEPVAVDAARSPKLLLIPKRSNELKKLFTDSLIIALFGLAAILALGFIVYWVRRPRRAQATTSFADVLKETSEKNPDSSSLSGEDQRPLTPEMKEAQVREMMATKNLTYDEATLRIQYTQPGSEDE